MDGVRAGRGNLRAAAVLVGTLAALAFLGGLAYWSWLERRAEYLIGLRFRALAATSEQIADTVAAIRVALEARARAATGDAAGRSLAGAPPPPACEGIPNLRCLWTGREARLRQGAPGATPPRKGTAGEATRLEWDRAADRGGLHLSYLRWCDPSSAEHDAAACGRSREEGWCASMWGGETLCGRVQLAQLVREVVPEEFDAIMLADTGRGDVIHQEGLASGAVANLAALPLFDRPASSGKPGEAATADRLPLAPAGIARVRLLDQPHLLFCEALVGRGGVVTATDVEGEPAAFSLCGLVRESRVDAERLEIPWQLAFLLLVALVLAVLAIPVLKLLCLGPRERLRAVDVKVLVLACVAGTGLGTLALDALLEYRALGAALDARLESIAGQARTQLAGEVEAATRALDAFLAAVRGAGGDVRRERLEVGADAARLVDLLVVDGHGAPLAHFTPTPGLPLVAQPAVSATAGAPAWSLQGRPPPPGLNVSDRRYFADAWSARGWKAGSPVAIEPVWSRLRGQLALVAARREGDTVGLVSTGLTPFRYAAGSPGLEVALVSRDGAVQVHSRWKKSLQENLVLESDGNARLRAALWNGSGGHLDVTYLGRSHRAFVLPVPATGWSVVTLLDDRVRQAAGAEALAAAAVLLLLYVLVGVLAAVAVQMARPDYRARWLWPERQAVGAASCWRAAALLAATAAVANGALRRVTEVAASDHERLAPICLAVLLVAVPAAALALLSLVLGRRERLGAGERGLAAATALLGGAAVLAATVAAGDRLGVASAGVLGLCWSLQVRPWLGTRRSPLAAGVLLAALAAAQAAWGDPISAAALGLATLVWCGPAALPARLRPWARTSEAGFRLAYVTMAFVLLAVLASLQAHALWRDAHRQVSVELARFDARHVEAAAAQERVQLAVDRERERAAHGEVPSWLQAAAVEELRIWPRTGSREPTVRAAAPGLVSALVFPHLPAYSELAAHLRAMDRVSGEEGVRAPRPEREARLTVRAESAVATLLAAVLAMGLLGAIVRSVFLLDVDAAPPGRRATAAAERVVTAWTFSRPADAFLSLADPHARVARLDLRQGAELPALRGWVGEHAEGGAVVEIDHLDARLDDPDGGEAALAMLEDLARRDDTNVVLTAEADPVEQLSAKLAGAEGTGKPDPAAAQWRRWMDLLATFVRRPVTAEAAADGDGRREVRAAAAVGRAYAVGGLPPATDAGEGDARHWRVWLRCTVDEKLALRQLAEEGFLNPANARAVRALMRRGLLRREGTFELATPGFREFVLRADPPETVARWEREGGPSAWSRLRMPLGIAVVLGGVFFVRTQPEMSTSLVGLLTALTAAVPILLRLFGFLGEERTAASNRS